MQKKVIILIVSLILIICLGFIIWFVFTGNNNELNNNSGLNSNKANVISDKNVGVIYFSATGTTKRVAELIKKATDGDLIEIVPKDKYTDADLNYGNDDSRATKEQNDPSARPEIKNSINIDNYDVIFLGYPIWWGDVPKIILTFLDSNDLDSKIVIPFCTSGSTGISSSLST